MTDHDEHGHADTADASHDAGHHDGEGHAADTLGPIAWGMWGAGVLAVVAALLVAAGFVVASGFRFFDLLA